jgi:hypothetical protein
MAKDPWYPLGVNFSFFLLIFLLDGVIVSSLLWSYINFSDIYICVCLFLAICFSRVYIYIYIYRIQAA